MLSLHQRRRSLSLSDNEEITVSFDNSEEYLLLTCIGHEDGVPDNPPIDIDYMLTVDEADELIAMLTEAKERLADHKTALSHG